MTSTVHNGRWQTIYKKRGAPASQGNTETYDDDYFSENIHDGPMFKKIHSLWP